MSAAATPNGAAVQPGAYPQPGRDASAIGRGPRGPITTRARPSTLVAVARSLQWADEAAERGDHSDALAWLHVIEAIGDELPDTYPDQASSLAARVRHGSVSKQIVAVNFFFFSSPVLPACAVEPINVARGLAGRAVVVTRAGAGRERCYLASRSCLLCSPEKKG